MKERAVGIFDSGIGGISLLCALKKEFPNERFIYLGDNERAPYGNKCERELLEIALDNATKLLNYNVKAIIVACNTLSITCLDEIREFAGVETVGVFPPIEKVLREDKSAVMISTVQTAKRYSGIKGLSVYGLKDLAREIEDNAYDMSKIDIIKHLEGVNAFNKTLILGCTHFYFIKKQLFDHFKPKKIVGGNFFTVNYLKNKKILSNNEKTLDKFKCFEPLFIGKYATQNYNFYKKSGYLITNFDKKY